MPTYKSIRYIVPDEAVEHTDSINALADVDTSTVTPEVGQTLKWSAGNSRWQPGNVDADAPTISSPGAATLIESSATGRAVATMSASDPGGLTLSFLISDGNIGNAFTINSSTGAITTAAALDYETTSSYTLEITAYNTAGKMSAATQTVNVTNNPDPVISSISSVTLAEDASIGTSISTISATDPEGETITYSITAGNIGNAFTINSSTGAITTAATLDYEMTTTYNLTITATDASGEFGTATQTVNVTDVTETATTPTQKAIFALGETGNGWDTRTNVANLVSSTGVVASDTTTAASARKRLAAASYGGDKAIFGFGDGYGSHYGNKTNITNLLSNTGVMSSDVTGVGTARASLTCAGYGRDKAIFAMGSSSGGDIINLVSNSGVVASDTTIASGVSETTAHAAATFGYDKAIMAYGQKVGYGVTNRSNLVNNSGVIYSDTTGVGTARTVLSAANYGGDKAIFGLGFIGGNGQTMTNLVSNLGVVSTDTTTSGVTGRWGAGGVGYGGDKAIFAYGTHYNPITYLNMSNLVSNTGVMSSDTTGVGTLRRDVPAAGYSSTA